MADRVCVARIGAPHGVRGEVRLWTFTEDPMAVRQYGPLQAEDGSRVFEIVAARAAKDHIVARLRGVDDRDAAERLTNIKLYVAREQLPETDDDTFYYADLVGLAAVGKDGSDLGSVIAVHDFGAGTLLEIQPQHGASILLPFTTAAVPTVDLAGGKVVIVPPEETVEKAPLGKQD
ncbi:MAG: rRNA processing protein RimM [Alphaproteobacteria bacterium]|jgi:16S rRNA processing protein RimM|nr:rRNA processing protein RimM [Alphaproteobacteria bacterium]